MNLQREEGSSGPLITSGDGRAVRVGKDCYNSSLCITVEGVIKPWPVEDLSALQMDSLALLLAQPSELLLLGSGARHCLLPAALQVALWQLGQRVEVMTTAAACRTYRLLQTDGRRVATGLVIESEKMMPEKAVASFAAGCFWGVEEDFRCLPGVFVTTVGYAGGHVPNPDYEQVCSGTTGHAETVRVEYDSARLSYAELLTHFWSIHDPTTANRQGPDIGSQYRSVIFYHHQEQYDMAHQALQRLSISARFAAAIVTELRPAEPFFIAEPYHQQYLHRRRCTPRI